MFSHSNRKITKIPGYTQLEKIPEKYSLALNPVDEKANFTNMQYSLF